MRSVERIEQDIAELSKQVLTFAEELYDAYGEYLKVLSQAVEKQFILAVYHVCTQGYPTEFLGLSLSQRQELQQNLRSLAKQIQETFLEIFHKPGSEPSSSSYTLPDSPFILAQWLESTNPASYMDPPPPSGEPPYSEDASHGVIFHPNPPAQTGISYSDPRSQPPIPIHLSDHSTTPFPLNPPFEITSNPGQQSKPQAQETAKPPLTPDSLGQWQSTLEQEVLAELRALSHHANRLLQQSGILPKKLPEPLLQTANQSEMAEMVSNHPNLLNLVLATPGDSQSEEENADEDYQSSSPSLLKIIAIHLRLAEIEFASPQATLMRHKLRNLSAQLKNLRKIYRKKEKELAIAQAQSAWHASWFEE